MANNGEPNQGVDHGPDAESPGPGNTTVFFIVLLAALLVRGLYLYQQLDNPFTRYPVSDSAAYILEAERILSTGDWLGSRIFTYGGSAFYSYFLALVFLVLGKNFIAVQVLQHVVGALTCGLLALIGQRLYGWRLGLVLGIWAAVFPVFLYHEGLLLTSGWAVFFLCASLYFLLANPAGPSGPAGLAAGLFLGLAALCRPNILLLVPVYFLAALGPDWPTALRRPRGYAVVLGVLLIVLPVTGRNYLVGRDLVLISSGAGWNFYLGNNPEAQGFFQIPKSSGVVNDFTIYESAHRQAELHIGQKLQPSAGSRYWLGQGLAFLRHEPAAALSLYWQKFLLFWNSREISDMYDYEFFSRYSFLLHFTFLSFGPAALFGLLGAGWIVLAGSRRERVLPALAGVYLVSVLVFFVHSRLREPMAVFLILTTGYLLKNFRFKDIRPATTGCLLIGALLLSVLIFRDLPADTRELTESLAHTYYTLGRKMVKSGSYVKAGELFAAALETDRENIMIMVEAGRAAERAGRIDKARQYYQQVLPYKRFLPPQQKITKGFAWPDPRQMAVYDADLSLGRIALAQDDLAAAEQHLQAAAQRYAVGAEAHKDLSLTYERMGRYQEALAACLDYLRILPGDRIMQARAEELRRKTGE